VNSTIPVDTNGRDMDAENRQYDGAVSGRGEQNESVQNSSDDDDEEETEELTVEQEEEYMRLLEESKSVCNVLRG
jgi:hypothetical protein